MICSYRRERDTESTAAGDPFEFGAEIVDSPIHTQIILAKGKWVAERNVTYGRNPQSSPTRNPEDIFANK